MIAIAITDQSIYFAASTCAMVCRRANSADIFASIGEMPSALSIVAVMSDKLISLGFRAMGGPSAFKTAFTAMLRHRGANVGKFGLLKKAA